MQSPRCNTLHNGPNLNTEQQDVGSGLCCHVGHVFQADASKLLDVTCMETISLIAITRAECQ